MNTQSCEAFFLLMTVAICPRSDQVSAVDKTKAFVSEKEIRRNSSIMKDLWSQECYFGLGVLIQRFNRKCLSLEGLLINSELPSTS